MAWILTAATSNTGTSVVTHHNDTLRTGWNDRETSLTAANVNSNSFGLLAAVPLDDQVDAAPLVLAGQPFAGASGKHNIAFVVTENDSVYAIDTATGAVLGKRNLGAPVPESTLPAACNNNGENVGITSTPVIDAARQTLYLIADTYENGAPVFRIHALSVRNLADELPPVVVTATHRRSDNSLEVFTPLVQRQRAALLEANGTIYAAFGSYCDAAANISRGWVLGWSASTLAPLASNDLTDRAVQSPAQFFLASVWMSGAGLAADESGSLFFSTGNSDPATYDGVDDIQESVVRESPDLSTMQSLFTPSNQSSLDKNDQDLGAGGPLLIPRQPAGPVPDIAVAAGKDGRLFVLNRESLGGFSPSGNDVLDTVSIGDCWCAQSYFVGPDGVARIVTSGGRAVGIWRLRVTPTVALTRQSLSAPLSTGEDGGFFTSVSSNGRAAGSAVIWAVSRPTNGDPANVLLYAIKPADAEILFSAVAGTWPNTNADSDLVPVVANGTVLVASYGQLAIFGLLPPGGSARTAATVLAPPRPPPAKNAHEFYGEITALGGTRLLVRTRSGRTVSVDVSAAKRAFATADLVPGEFVFVRATTTAAGTTAQSIVRAKRSPALWAPDR
jgi:hypothetical protein